MTSNRFDCPACGSPLDPPPDTVSMRCPNCGSTVVVPEDLRRLTAQGTGSSNGHSEPVGEVIFEDDFRDPDTGWEILDEAGVRVEYSPRGYRLYLEGNDTFWEAYADLDADDVSVEVEITRVKGPRDGVYGLLCRVAEDGAYSFEIDGEGYYGIYKDVYGETEDDDEFYTLAEGNAPGVVHTDGQAVNHLRAVCQGSHLTLYVNNRVVLEAEDDEFLDGDVGLMAATGESGRGGLDVLFNHFVVRRA